MRDAVIAGDLVLGWDARRRRGTHKIGALCCDEDAGAVCMGGFLYGRICMGEGEGEASFVWGEGQAAFLLWAGDWECGLRRERAHAPNGLKSYHPHNFLALEFFFSCAACWLYPPPRGVTVAGPG
jgi:hypothetical protein